ncbi:MAG: hypothetical protein EHM58_03290 [Ignavibacteriae bacterium]|nr:MAG: hypothetical protein EHM58_03290 [Ignavibacteriota bacterium]
MILKIFFISKLLIIIYFVLAVNTLQACPKCTANYLDELLWGSKSNSLMSKEISAAIENQKNSLQPSGSGVSVISQTQQPVPPPVKQEGQEFIEIIERDNRLSIPPTSYVPQNTAPTKKVSIELSEGEVYIGNGVMFKGFITNGTVPGPTIIVDEGDIVEFTVVNKGLVPHGASIHAAYTQTSKYLGKIPSGETRTMVFKVPVPGVYLYHCAPGGHAIPMHVLFGQYGMMVVKPKKQYKLEQILNKKPDVELYLMQHEYYASGKDAVESKPFYVAFNGKLFRYVESPVKAKPGDYVRIYFLNAGPNLISTFHIVGILWDFVYWQGHPDNPLIGGQTVTSGPSDSWVIEFRMPPDEGSYVMLTHAVGSSDRGAIGLLNGDRNAPTPAVITAEGPIYTEQEMKDVKPKIKRVISPFEPGTPDVDPPQVFGPDVKEVTVHIMGNSYYPKIIRITEGTKVKWINEDIFTYMEGELGGVHNASSYEGPEPFNSPLLAHTETFEFVFNTEGNYKYLCTPHPYMRGFIEVIPESGTGFFTIKLIGWLVVITLALILTLSFFIYKTKKRVLSSL